MIRYESIEWCEEECSVPGTFDNKRKRPDALSRLLALGCTPDTIAFEPVGQSSVDSAPNLKRRRLHNDEGEGAPRGVTSDAAPVVPLTPAVSATCGPIFRWPIMQLPMQHLRRRHLFIAAQKQQLRAVYANPNQHVTRPLTQLAELYQLNLDNENTGEFRARNTTQAVNFLSRLPFAIKSPFQLLALLGSCDSRKLRALGSKSVIKILSLLGRGELPPDALQETLQSEARKELQAAYGIGPGTASKLVTAGVTGIADLRRRLAAGGAEAQRVRDLIFNVHTEAMLPYYEDLQVRIPRAEVEEIIATVRAAAEKVYAGHPIAPTGIEVYCCGSYRRGKASSGDVDILIVGKERTGRVLPLDPLVAHLASSGFLVHSLSGTGPASYFKSSTGEAIAKREREREERLAAVMHGLPGAVGSAASASSSAAAGTGAGSGGGSSAAAGIAGAAGGATGSRRGDVAMLRHASSGGEPAGHPSRRLQSAADSEEREAQADSAERRDAALRAKWGFTVNDMVPWPQGMIFDAGLLMGELQADAAEAVRSARAKPSAIAGSAAAAAAGDRRAEPPALLASSPALLAASSPSASATRSPAGVAAAAETSAADAAVAEVDSSDPFALADQIVGGPGAGPGRRPGPEKRVAWHDVEAGIMTGAGGTGYAGGASTVLEAEGDGGGHDDHHNGDDDDDDDELGEDDEANADFMEAAGLMQVPRGRPTAASSSAGALASGAAHGAASGNSAVRPANPTSAAPRPAGAGAGAGGGRRGYGAGSIGGEDAERHTVRELATLALEWLDRDVYSGGSPPFPEAVAADLAAAREALRGVDVRRKRPGAHLDYEDARRVLDTLARVFPSVTWKEAAKLSAQKRKAIAAGGDASGVAVGGIATAASSEGAGSGAGAGAGAGINPAGARAAGAAGGIASLSDSTFTSTSHSLSGGHPQVVPVGSYVLSSPPPPQWRTLPEFSYDTRSFMGLCRLPDKGDGSRRHFRRIDLKTYPREYLPFALLYFTGSDHFNRSMRAYVHLCGWTLSDKGLSAADRSSRSGEVTARSPSIDASDEADVFAAIGLPFRAPHERDTDAPAAPAAPAAPTAPAPASAPAPGSGSASAPIASSRGPASASALGGAGAGTLARVTRA